MQKSCKCVVNASFSKPYSQPVISKLIFFKIIFSENRERECFLKICRATFYNFFLQKKWNIHEFQSMYERERKNGTAGQKVLEEGKEPFSFHNHRDEIKCQPPSSFLCPSISIYPFIRASIHCHAIFCFAFQPKNPLAFHLMCNCSIGASI